MLSMSTDTEPDVKEKLENDSVREILILTAFSVYAISYLKMVYLEKVVFEQFISHYFSQRWLKLYWNETLHDLIRLRTSLNLSPEAESEFLVAVGINTVEYRPPGVC